MAMDDEMQTFRQKTGRKNGCHGCIYADWDADGANCKLDGLNVWNPAKGCKYRKAQSVTNGDKIRSMTDEQLADAITADAFCGKVTGEIATISDCSDRKCIDCVLQWLRKEAEP